MLLLFTGKTTAIVEIILQEVKRGNKVLSLFLSRLYSPKCLAMHRL